MAVELQPVRANETGSFGVNALGAVGTVLVAGDHEEIPLKAGRSMIVGRLTSADDAAVHIGRPAPGIRN